ncbi:hypothetical protein C6Y14_12020 [Streptomyces dioscori]|uniref:Acyl-CoA dehydrogenase n=1 Tax=Streptomyces dioscori TaxID=2109333 RepID=A0A2P8Q9H9_9ACTN|nr:hypothetical protein [Streptomyces dioscori]PSM42911.1 hypothetical protein C6Y14_12020 [Streptomyces dioscori]
MTAFTDGGHPTAFGPDSGLAQVLSFFEPEASSFSPAAWQAFTATWNWAAPLATAFPLTDPSGGPAARPVPGGFTLSGRWQLPPRAGTARWLALPLTGGVPQPTHTTTHNGPDLFVLPSKVLTGAVDGSSGDDDMSRPVFRSDGLYVPTGFATYAGGTPLRAEDAAFVWTAAAALALGTARRITYVLAVSAPSGTSPENGGSVPVTVAAAELASVLHDERLSLAAVLQGAPSARQGLSLSAAEKLAAHVRQTVDLVHHVIAVAYERALMSGRDDRQHPLAKLIESGTPILQQARYVTELLPPSDATGCRKVQDR